MYLQEGVDALVDDGEGGGDAAVDDDTDPESVDDLREEVRNIVIE